MPGTLKLKSDAGGSISLAANTTAASDLTVSVPPFAATMATLVANTAPSGPYFSVPNVAGNGPTFSAFASSATSVTNGGWTKILYATKMYDTNNFYDTTASRFTPTVAGYYLINGTTSINGTITNTNNAFSIWKNGTEFIRGSGVGVVSGYLYNNVTGIVYMNGTSDYVELFQYNNSGGTITTQYSGNSVTSPVQVFQAILMRSA